MKKLVATAPRVAALVEYEDRAILANEVKIRVRFGAPKHGTEVVDFRAASPFIDEDFNGEWQMFTPRPADAPRGIEFGKFQLGNMVVGDIIECGSDVTDYAVGDSVCGYGPLSETVIINAVNNYKLRKMPQGSSWKNAVCYDPAQFAMSGVRDANVRVGDFVVVVGLGAIGQIAIQLAKRAGASVVIGVDPIAYRCDIARRHGADFCLNPIGTDVGKEIKTLTGKQGADVIIETSGYADALQSALRGLAYGGTISYVAFAKPFAEGFNLGREAHFNNAKIVFSRACSEPNPDYPRWSRKRIEETCWELLMNGYLNCEDLIDPVVTFANSPESYMQYVDQHPAASGTEHQNGRYVLIQRNEKMKIGTQNQAFFPENILEKFRYIKEMGFDGFEIDGKLLVNNLEEVKAAIKETGLPVTTACGGYDGWIGDFIEERRLNGLKQIERILEALAEVGGKGIVVPAAWGMFTFRLPPMTSPRSLDGDRKMVSDSLRVLEQVAARTGTVVYLEPLNRYQDHMINTLDDARRYIVENDLKHVQIIGDFYHMNIEEDNLAQALHDNRDLLGHVHIADNHRYQPGSGTLDFHALFEQLRADNYQGYVVYEGRIRAEDPAQAYRDSLAWLRTC